MSPAVLGQILGGAALVGVGVGIGARAVRRHLPRTLAHLLTTEIRLAREEARTRRLEQQVAQAQEGLAELRASIPHVWDLAAKATEQRDVFRLVVSGVEAQQRQRGTWN